jgi:intein/homing endonuclease
MGAFAGLGVGYGVNVSKQFAYRKAGLDLTAASKAVQLEEAFTRSSLYNLDIPEKTFLGIPDKSISLIKEQADKQLSGFGGRIARKIAGVQKGKGLLGGMARLLGKTTPSNLGWKAGILAGAALVSPFIPGALVPSERPEELEALYSGEKKVAIRKGRWWEFSKSPYEGGRITQFQQHWFPRMLARAKEKSMWGENVPSPLEQWWKENFTYELETRHYSDRPYPVSGAAFQDVPLIGPLLSATVGRIFKPPVLMHQEEWMRSSEQGTETLASPLNYGEEVLPGDLERGSPISPFGLKGTIGRQIYNMTEMVGLPGFTMTAIKEAITGEADTFTQEAQLESANRMYGAERSYWDLELGGGLGCFRKGTPISTLKEIKEIQDIQVGDIILSTSGKYRKVINKVIKKASEFTTIYIKGFNLKLTSTSNHHIPVLHRHTYNNKGNYKHPKPFNEENITITELQAKDIKKGDFLFLPIPQYEEDYIIDLKEFGKTYTDDWVYNSASQEWAECREYLEKIGDKGRITRSLLRKQRFSDKIAKDVLREYRANGEPYRIKRFWVVDRELANVIGWYIAEGCEDGSKLTFTLHANEVKYAENIRQFFNKNNISSSIFIEKNTLRLKVYSTILAKYFRIFGERANKKHIPYMFKQLPLDKLEILVNSLMEGDGWNECIGKRTGTHYKGGFTSSSESLVNDLSECLLRLQKHHSIYLNYTEQPKKDITYPQGTKRKKTLRHYLQLRHGKFDWKFYKNHYLLEVSKIEQFNLKEENVYDLTIEDTEHYTANRILVHNTTEVIRRLYPHRRRQIELYNPLRNQMPDWLPGAGERSEDFLHGDPLTKVPLGEERLPGAGYAATRPWLQGVDPADYPIVDRFQILGDVAPYTDKFKEAQQEVRAAIARKQLSKEEIARYKETLNEVKAKKVRREFTPYKWKDRSGTPIETVLAQANELEKQKGEDGNWFVEAMGRYWETLAHNAETPFEYITPISPAHKLVHMRTAVEDYEQNQAYGTENGFWDHPIRDFFGPFFDNAKHALGFTGIPEHIQERRD